MPFILPIGFRRDYEQNITKKKVVSRKGLLIKKDVYENISLLLKYKIYVIFKNKDIEKFHLKRNKVEEIGKEISKKLLESSKDISDKLSQNNYDKFEEKHKEELKEYKENPKFPPGFKVKEITKEEWEREHPNIKYPEGGLFRGYPIWSVSYQLEFNDFSVIILFEIRKDFQVVTQDSIEKLSELIKNDFKFNSYEVVEEAEKVREYILKSDKKVIELFFKIPDEISGATTLIDSVKMFKEQEKMHSRYH